jgi:hypothetical protein
MKRTSTLIALLASAGLGGGALAQDNGVLENDNGVFEEDNGVFENNGFNDEDQGVLDDNDQIGSNERGFGGEEEAEDQSYARDQYGFFKHENDWDANDEGFEDWYGDADEGWFGW